VVALKSNVDDPRAPLTSYEINKKEEKCVGEFGGTSGETTDQCSRTTTEGDATSPTKTLRRQVHRSPLLHLEPNKI
jgi:hypothetical protein